MAVSQSPIHPGKSAVIFDGALEGSGTKSVSFSVDSDSVLLSLYVRSVDSGDVTVTASTVGVNDTEDVQIIDFPVISAPTSDLLLRRSAIALQKIRVDIEYTGDCELSIIAKAVSLGEATVRILGANNAVARQLDVGTSPVVLVPSGLVDRTGLIIKNNNTSGVMYVGFTSAEAAAATGYPLEPGANLSIDLDADQAVYGVAATGTIDVRIIEAGGSN